MKQSPSIKAWSAFAVLLTAASAHAQTATDSQRIEQLERQVQVLQQKDAMPKMERVRFNGFLSVAYASGNNDAGYFGYQDDYNLERESRLGLQGTFKIDASTEVIMQLVARGADKWDPVMEWAYIAHNFTNNFKARAGKMRLPLYMFSDSLEVGYAQPWARPPIEVYDEVPFTSYTGVDGIYDWNLNNSTLTAQAFTGQSKATLGSGATATELDIRDIYGASLTWTDFVWTARGIYSGADVVLGGSALAATFYGFGFGFNNGNWQVLAELTNIEVDGPTGDPQSAYITVAKRFGAITPYLTFSTIETKDNNERPLSAAQAFALMNTPGSPYYNNPTILSGSDLNNVEREATSLGLRWDAMTNVAVKFDVTRTDSFGDTGGGLGGNAVPVRQYDNATIYTVKLDAVF